MDYIFPCLNYAISAFKPKSNMKLYDVSVSLCYDYYALINRQRTYKITAYYLNHEDKKHTEFMDISVCVSLKLGIMSSATNIYLT